jgi:dolichol-phosphate mannosyltransferase
MSRLLVTLCTYNERGNLRELIAAVHEQVPHATVLVIDDNSPDGTGALADELAAADSRVVVRHRAGKLGLGSATLAGFRHAIEQQFELLLNLDADFSHPPRYIPAMLAQMGEYDVTIASRYVAGGGVAGWSLHRKLMSRGMNLVARVLLGLKTADSSGSYRCYRVARLAEINWDLTVAAGYAFQEEILYRCARIGCRMTEVPFVFEDRRYGVTKLTLRECTAAFLVMLRLGGQRLLRRPVRVEQPGA